jgi:hypothetical protein
MRASTIFVFFLTLLSVRSHLYFQQKGWIVDTPAYGHIHFTVDTNIIKAKLTEIQSAIGSLRKRISSTHNPTIQARANVFLRNAHIEIDTLIEQFNDLLDILGSTHSDPKRVKRFLGLLLAIGSISLGLFNQAEILHLQASMSNIIDQQNHIIDILQEHEVSIHNVQQDVSKIRDAFLIINEMVQENEAITKIQEAEIQTIMVISTIRRVTECIQHGIEKLMTHRIPLCFLNTGQIQRSLAGLSHKAHSNKLEPVSQHMASFLQYETSFLLVNGQIQVYVHVPLIDPSKRMDLLRFNNAPMPISNTLTFALAPSENYLAISKEGLHATISQLRISTCKQYNYYLFCGNPLVLNKKINSTCLGAIYSQNFEQLKSICPAVFFQPSETITEITSNEYILYTTQPQTIQVTCKDKTTHIAVQGSHHLTLKSPCEVSTNEHIIRTGFTLSVDEEVKQWPWNWNISENIFGIERSDLERIVKDLQLIHRHPTPIRDLHQAIKNNTYRSGNIWLSSVLVILALITSIVVVFLMSRYMYLHRQNSKSQLEINSDNGGI